MSRRCVIAAVCSMLPISTALALDWSSADIEMALRTIEETESGTRECAVTAGTTIAHDVTQRDINGDGVQELEVRSYPKELKNGSSGCYSASGQAITLLRSDPQRGWIPELGFDAVELRYHPNQAGEWPDIELSGASIGIAGTADCNPMWRFHNGGYRPWKVCDDNGRQIYADVAPWIGADVAVPRDAGEKIAVAAVRASKRSNVKTLDGPEFDHNGSVMVVDHKRGLIVYKEPKKSLGSTVKPGDVLFKGEPWDQYEMGRPISGTAYVFKKGCDPAPYQVKGGFRTSWHTIVLKGDGPVRAKGSCDIAGYKSNGNSSLEFQNLDD